MKAVCLVTSLKDIPSKSTQRKCPHGAKRWFVLGVTISLAFQPVIGETLTGQHPLQFRLIESLEVDLGPRSIIYNRVEKPILQPQPPPINRPSESTQAVAPTFEELEELRRWESMTYVSMSLSCTVYDGQFTEVRLHQDGHNIIFWSTINFHYLSHLFDFLAGNTCYSIFLGLGDASLGELPVDLQNKPPTIWTAEFLAANAGKSAWMITSNVAISPETIRAIEDLHSYFDTNKEALIAQHNEREAIRIAQEQHLKANPPQPKDTVVNYFPIQSGQPSGRGAK